MKKRGITSAARRVGVIVITAALLISLVTIGWGYLAAQGQGSLLGPSARQPALVAARGRGLPSGLVNLTQSPASERSPAWSPSGSMIAFTADGVDTNNDGRIDATSAQRFLYTMSSTGGSLTQYPLAAGSVLSLAWRADGQALYTVVLENGAYSIRLLTLTTKTYATLFTPSPSSRVIGTLASPPSGSVLYFDMQGVDGNPNVFVMPDNGGGTPTQLTTGGANRNPAVLAGTGGSSVLFESSRTGRWGIYRMDPNGANVTPWTIPGTTGDDSEPRASADGRRLVFVSTRPTSSNDYIYDQNIWIMDNQQEGSGTPAVRAVPRYFSETTDQSAQIDPAPQVITSRINEMLFVSNHGGNSDIYLGALEDAEAPYITAPPTATPKVAVPGQDITITVPVADTGSGVRNVWLQIKDPDPAALDSLGQSHVITRPAMDWELKANGDGNDAQDIPTEIPVEFGPFDPATNTYLNTTLATSHPGYYARAGSPVLFTDEGQGYPEVPAHWLRMYDDGTHGDVSAGDGIYACRWTTPAISSDWYLDVIVEDMANVASDALNQWHGNRRRFDNVGGCSTQIFTGGKRILFVDDYVDGQRFLSLGGPDQPSQYEPAFYPNSLYYFIDGTGPMMNQYITPFAPGSEYGGADVWRLLARGPVSEQVFAEYTPITVTQLSPADKQAPVQVRNGDRLIVWASPVSWHRLLPLRTSAGGSGSIIEASVQNRLLSFAAAGGRLFIIGHDAATGLTNGGTQSSALLTTLGVALTAQTISFGATAPPYNLVRMPVPSTDSSTTPPTGWYGSTLAQPRWLQTYVMPKNNNPGQYVTSPLGGKLLCWDVLKETYGGEMGFNCQGDPADKPTLLAIARANTQTGSRSVLWSFDYAHLSSRYRARPALDTIEWLLDGSVAGKVTRVNDLMPIPGALVVVSKLTNIGTVAVPIIRKRDVAAMRTDAQGQYILHGIQPGPSYRLSVVATGYYGDTERDIVIRGGQILQNNNSSFILTPDSSTSMLWGYVTRGGAPVSGASVRATPVGGGTDRATTTDATGRYELANLPSGEYMVTATQGSDTASRRVTLSLGVTSRVDLTLTAGTPVAGVLGGVVMGGGSPIAGATVIVRQGTLALGSASTDQNGVFEIRNLTTGIYSLEVTAPGFITFVQTVTFNAQTGALLSISLTPISSDPQAGRLSGRVYDGSTANPLGGAVVEVLVNGILKESMTTAGRFETAVDPYNFYFVLDPGVYTLRVRATGRRTQERIITLQPNQLLSDLEFHMMALLTLNQGVCMVSLPGDYQGQDFSTLFTRTDGSVLSLNGRLATYNTVQGAYNIYQGAGAVTILPAQAFWMRLDAPVTVQREGQPISTATPYVVALARGWNLVGNPFDFAVDLFTCMINVAGVPPQTWSEAVTAGQVGAAVYSWDGRSYSMTTTVQPYLGYWIYARSACTLSLNNQAAASAAPVAVTRARPSATGWQVRLEARVGQYQDTENYLGVAADATDGFNALADLREPPKALGGGVSLSFPHRTWGQDAGDFSTDIHGVSAGEQRWVLRVETDQPDAQVVLNWPELMAQMPGGMQAIITDLTTQQACYMNTTTSYAFKSSATGGARDFEIRVGPRTAGLVVSDIRGIASTRGRGEMTIGFSLSQTAEVHVVIRSQSGRVIRVLGTGVKAVVGENTLNWDGRDHAGRLVPRGLYVCEVRAVDATGRAARGTGLLALRTVLAH